MDKTTVLIVEDEAIVAADLAGKLGQLGYEVVGAAAEGEKAVELACSLEPQVVLMDIWLKGAMDGIEAAEAIRSRHDVPVIYLTAHSDSATLERAKLSGPFGYILKPFEERELSTTIEMALYKHQSDRQLREQQEVLRKSHAELEMCVAKRTQELKELNNTLEEQVIERTAQLNSATETLRASRRAALNLMEDAVIARKKAEETSDRLRLEIAERQRSEEALRESESFCSQTLESIPGMVFTTRPDGYCDYQSTQWVVFTGVPMSEHLGDGWNSLLHPEDRPRAFDAWCAAVEGRAPYNLEYRVRRHDGKYEWFKVIGRPIRDAAGRIVKWFGVAVNIDANKQAEEELVYANQRSRMLAETTAKLLASDSPQGVVDNLCRRVMEVLDCQAFFNFLVDKEAGRLHLNACAGIPDEEVKKLEWLDYGVAVCGCAARDAIRIVAEDIPNTPDPRTELVNSYGIQAYACHPLMVQDKLLGTLSFGTRNRPAFTKDELALMKAVADHVAIAMDRKQMEEELRHAREAAEAANRAKSLFLANMSHELRTPMTGVLGMLEIARSGHLDEKQREAIYTAHMSGQSLLMILNDILDLTRIETGKLAIEENPFAMRECLRGTVDILIPAARNKGLDLHWSMAEEMPETLVGDRIRLQQVLTNLVSNAVKFTERGKVEVTVTAGSETADGNRDITFKVSDTGIGIPAEKKELIFEAFNQADISHSRQYGGTGLGLSISKELVELMGGTITLESVEGKGSSFSFSIPLLEAGLENAHMAEPVTVAPVEAAVPLVADGKARLLVAEDDEVTRKVMGFMLQRSGFDFEFAMDGRQVVEMWEQGGYDLVVMDGQMPVMDGFAATAAIRERERERGGHIPILAMTAHALETDKERCLACGMDAYVSKPIDFKKCMEVIRGLLGQGEK